MLGIASAFEITARQSMLIELVGRESLPNAIALQSTAFNLSRVLGPALMVPFSLLFPQNSAGWVFLLNSLSFVAIVVSLFFIETRHKVHVKPRQASIVHELREGGMFIIKKPSIGLIILIAAILGMLGLPFSQQLPVISTDILSRAGDTKAIIDMRNSLLYTAQGSGALLAAISIAINNSEKKRGLRLLAGEAAFIFGILAIPLLRSVGIAVVVMAFMSWGAVTQMATMTTLVQTQVPDSLRGRVFSVYLWALQGITPFGSLLIGWMAQSIGISITALICGTVLLAVVGGLQALRPEIRQPPG